MNCARHMPHNYCGTFCGECGNQNSWTNDIVFTGTWANRLDRMQKQNARKGRNKRALNKILPPVTVSGYCSGAHHSDCRGVVLTNTRQRCLCECHTGFDR